MDDYLSEFSMQEFTSYLEDAEGVAKEFTDIFTQKEIGVIRRVGILSDLLLDSCFLLGLDPEEVAEILKYMKKNYAAKSVRDEISRD